MPASWVETLLDLPRPEYAKQPEALLTDLLWRSAGSTLHAVPVGQRDYLGELAALTGENGDRLIPRRAGGKPTTVETFPIATRADVTAIVASADGLPSPVRALLESILAPRARGERSSACVPVHPDVAALQTLPGLVNKTQPTDLAKAVEMVGWLGGSSYPGQVAAQFLNASARRAAPREGLVGLLDALCPVVAQQTWRELTAPAGGQAPARPWPGVAAAPVEQTKTTPLAGYQRTPFGWFWRKWSALCDPANGWYERLPIRRFVDWSTCLLRTGLAFGYIWEAEFFIAICVRAKELDTGIPAPTSALAALLRGDTTLGTIENPLLPATQKDAWGALRSTLATGYVARRRVIDELQRANFPAPTGMGVEQIADAWLGSLGGQLSVMRAPLLADKATAPNLREFVRNLLLPRVSDDDAADQSDFYYFARTNASRSVWFEPGPEWLVVVTSLLGIVPGRGCTLRMLMEDLAHLGVRVERSVLVGMLEEAGLSSDSPDADDALVIRAGF